MISTTSSGQSTNLYLDPDGTFDIPKFEGTVFAKGSAGKGETKNKEDGIFVN
jgi:xylulose-5-phosphate/fructose-6-phosphate phosphoketolase